MRTGVEQWVVGRLTLVRAATRLPAAAFPLIIAATHGASSATDCFFLVYAGILFATNTLMVGETAVVPFVSAAREGNEENRLLAAISRRLVLYLTPVSVGLCLTALIWKSFASISPAGWEEGWRHLLIFAAVPILSGLAAVLSGYLNASERFLTAAMAVGIRGVVMLALGFSLSPTIGLSAYSIGILAGEITAVAWLITATRLRLPALFSAAPVPVLGEFWALFSSLLAGGLANSSKGFVNRYVASLAGPGAVSLLEYAERVFLLIVSFIGAPFTTVLLSRWAAAFHASQQTTLGSIQPAVARARRVALGCAVSILLLYWILSVTVSSESLLRQFSPAERKVVQVSVAMYLLGVAPYLLGLILMQAIIIVRDSSFLMIVAIAVAIANLPLNLVGLLTLGVPGIALTSSALHVAGWLAAELRFRTHLARSGVTLTQTIR